MGRAMKNKSKLTPLAALAGLGKVGGADSLIAATGYSLGGHLATAFTRFFAAWTNRAVTFNGAGYPTGGVPGLTGTAQINIPNLFNSAVYLDRALTYTILACSAGSTLREAA